MKKVFIISMVVVISFASIFVYGSVGKENYGGDNDNDGDGDVCVRDCRECVKRSESSSKPYCRFDLMIPDDICMKRVGVCEKQTNGSCGWTKKEEWYMCVKEVCLEEYALEDAFLRRCLTGVPMSYIRDIL